MGVVLVLGEPVDVEELVVDSLLQRQGLSETRQRGAPLGGRGLSQVKDKVLGSGP